MASRDKCRALEAPFESELTTSRILGGLHVVSCTREDRQLKCCHALVRRLLRHSPVPQANIVVPPYSAGISPLVLM